MAITSSPTAKAIAGVRIATSVFFLLFGEYKLAGPGFAHGAFQGYLQDYIANGAVSFYRPVLSGLVLPHAVVLGYAVGVIESFIGLSLLLGLWVRPASVLGGLYMLNSLLPLGGARAMVRRSGAISAPSLITCRCCCYSSSSSPPMPGRSGAWMGGEGNSVPFSPRSFDNPVRPEGRCSARQQGSFAEHCI